MWRRDFGRVVHAAVPVAGRAVAVQRAIFTFDEAVSFWVIADDSLWCVVLLHAPIKRTITRNLLKILVAIRVGAGGLAVVIARAGDAVGWRLTPSRVRVDD